MNIYCIMSIRILCIKISSTDGLGLAHSLTCTHALTHVVLLGGTMFRVILVIL